MEIVLIIIIIAAVCICFGVPTELIIFGVICIIGLALAAMFFLFAYSFVCLLFSRKCDARFVRIEKKGKFSSAVYIVDGAEYFCIFPCEAIFRKRIYNPEKPYTVRLNKRIKRVFDRNALITCITGFLFSAVSSGFAAAFIYVISTVGTKGV